MKRRQTLHPHTITINKAQKLKSQKIKKQALEWLAIRFPEAFNNTKRIRPLKIGIMNDILQYAFEAKIHDISRSKLREAVTIFTRRLDYLTCIKLQERRIDLNGNIVGFVTEVQAETAARQVKLGIDKKLRNLYEPNNSLPEHNNHQFNASLKNSSVRSNISIKHKTTRAYDPNTLTRIKEKLGLAQNKINSAK